MKEEPPYVAETLSWCNAIRVTKGMMEPLDKLPKGRRGDGYSCPCGKATGVYVGQFGWGPTAELYGESRRDVPQSVMYFVDAFDKGLLPQYDAEI